ncbi:hypothetical protein JT06_00270 [Desulfobulbus sp. Tol-SR]|nr:hypothetical protein JT06_00270 [Desulfobulbus sp. Tol-SR]
MSLLVLRVGLDQVIDPLPQQTGHCQPGIVEMAELVQRGVGGFGNAVQALELLGELVGDEPPGFGDKGGQAVAGWFVKGHGHSLGAVWYE